ncbi:MAG TPA: glycosyltransferase family 4 protein [Longimicrobium sp.]
MCPEVLSPPRPVAVLAANRAYGIVSSRLAIVEHLAGQGWRVVVAAARDHSAERLAAHGAEFVEIPFRRGGIDPRSDAAAFLAVRRLYRRLRPRLVHHFNTKPIVLGGLAVRGLPETVVVNTVTGLGYGLNGAPSVAGVLRTALRHTLSRAAATVFQNADDLRYFTAGGLVDPARAHLIASSGVDVARFAPPAAEPAEVRVVLVGRMVWQKGLALFAEAARRVGAAHPGVRFVVGGEFDPGHPDAVPREWIDAQVRDGAFEFMGYVSDMPALLRETSIFVLPSTFGEGFPRVLIEAGATGVPVVTFDLPGCREAVVSGETGVLVPPGDSGALAAALERLIGDPELRRRMGRAARRRVEEHFDRRDVVRRTLALYGAAGVHANENGA